MADKAAAAAAGTAGAAAAKAAGAAVDRSKPIAFSQTSAASNNILRTIGAGTKPTGSAYVVVGLGVALCSSMVYVMLTSPRGSAPPITGSDKDDKLVKATTIAPAAQPQGTGAAAGPAAGAAGAAATAAAKS
jgi:hypothetical protein